MDQQNFDQPAETEQPASIDRRRFLAGTTAVTAAVWAAPSVVTIDRAFGAHESPATCDTSAYDMGGTFQGTVNGVLDPVSSCEDSGSQEWMDITSIVVGSTSLGQGRLLLADCTTNPCCARSGMTDVVLTIPGLPTIGVAALNAEACCTDHTTTRSSTLMGLTIGGNPVPVDPGPNTTIPVPFGTLILNEQPADSDTVNAFHLLANVPGVQVVDLILGSATADC